MTLKAQPEPISTSNTNANTLKSPGYIFPIHPKEDPVKLLLTSLQLVSTNEVLIQDLTQWVERSSKHLSPDEIREPNMRIHYFFQHSSSLVELAYRNWHLFEARAQHYGPERLALLAQYLIAVRVIVRYREQANQRKSATPEVDQIAVSRAWRNTADVIRDLGEVEDRLVALGAAALIDKPVEQEAFLADEDDGSFKDQFDDVRRRVDIARKNRNEFDAVGITEGELEMTDKLLQDADIFYRGREARSIFSRQLTELRDKAFTLAFLEMQKLQLVFRAVTYGDKTIADHISGKFWQRLNKLSRKRRNRGQNNNEESAASVDSSQSSTEQANAVDATSQASDTSDERKEVTSNN